MYSRNICNVISIQSSTSYAFTVSHSAREFGTDYTSIKRLLWRPPQWHIYFQLEHTISIIYLPNTDGGVVVYYLKPSSRSTALNTRVTSYSSHPIMLSATIVLGCGFCCRLCANIFTQQRHKWQPLKKKDKYWLGVYFLSFLYKY